MPRSMYTVSSLLALTCQVVDENSPGTDEFEHGISVALHDWVMSGSSKNRV